MILNIFLVILTLFYICDGYGYGSYQHHDLDENSATEPESKVPNYLKNTKYAKTYNSGSKSGYGGTKSSYGGTKTGHGGIKTGYGGTKTGYGKTKTGYGETKTGYGSYQQSSWQSNGSSYESFQQNANMPYQPRCDPDCKNNGICVDTNTCHCPVNYYGTFCEFQKKPCLTYPPLPMNSMRKCSAELCSISCVAGHKFIDGSTIAEMKCAEGQWVPTRADLTSIPDCEPECSPACLNGGICLSVDTCQCPEDYRGPQCQYAASVCDVRKLGFNGGYSCHGDGERFTCTLNCPAGSTFSSAPAEEYVCLYSTGQFQPQPIPHCAFSDGGMIIEGSYHQSGYNSMHYNTEYNNSFSQSGYSQTQYGFGATSHYHARQPMQVVVQDLSPKGGTCIAWANTHYKTFDGVVYSFQSACQHILVQDATAHKFTVAVKADACKSSYYCPTEITVFLEQKEYVLSAGEDGSVIFRTSRRTLPIPATLPGIRVSMPSDTVVVDLDSIGLSIKWDTDNVVVIEASVQLWNATEGLCGRLDGNVATDLLMNDGNVAKTKTAFASSWQLDKIGETCDKPTTENSYCLSKSDDDMKQAQHFCNTIFTKEKFKKCFEVMDVSILFEACEWDYCACTKSLSPEECACRTVSVYARECLKHGVKEMRFWRDEHTCPMHCTDGKVYKACGPDMQPSCAFPQITAKPQANNSTCVEGCFCPEGLMLEGGRCVMKSDCPCRLRNRSFQPGATVSKDCNTCTCVDGSWRCSGGACGARCAVLGDPHYVTFDGRRYDFMGRCTYYLVRTDAVDVRVENVACSGAITEVMNLSPYTGKGKPSCTKAVYISYEGIELELKQGGLILANGKELAKLPASIGEVMVRAASSMFIIVQLPNEVDIWWDGQTRVYVDVPPAFTNKTKGLCGTFNLNQQDDFLTPEGDIEQSSQAFANKWKTREFCADVDTDAPEHPCSVNVQNKEIAEKYCAKLKGSLFEACHWDVDVNPYYEACLYDLCACDDITKCLCPIVGDYAMACAAKGVKIQWRYDLKECEVQCTNGQQYTVCADSCQRTCADISLFAVKTCKSTCVEGCACPYGQVLDDTNTCVPTGLCPCFHKGIKFNPGYKELRPGRRERELCTCIGARWSCEPATDMDIQNYPSAEELQEKCSAAKHLEFTACELAEPLTCKNMHLPQSTITAECRGGCQCKRGYVLDTSTGQCVVPDQCPCHHGGRSYPDGHRMSELCNTCSCARGNWSCSTHSCGGTCAAWGDGHVRSFDLAHYSFEGVCSYLLAKGDGFQVDIQNVPCGTTGATCSKSVTLTVGEEVVTLGKHEVLPDFAKLKNIKLRSVGTYIFLDVLSLGVNVQWDKETRIYVNVDPMWKGRLKGLCGNYNMDMRDDFQTPSSGGIAEASAVIFADSWKLKSNCPKTQDAKDHCLQRPERKEWAMSICGILKEDPFSKCHTEVPPDRYVASCVGDACACAAGAECACACGALAAYAAACAARAVPVRWRTPELCPMQCDGECSNYDPCMSACPLETCDNTLHYEEIKSACQRDTCVEGCKPNKLCPEGEVYSNASFSHCVPRTSCRPACLTLAGGRIVLEGEVIEEDACHTCTCSNKQRVCTGQPCFSTELPQAFTEVPTTTVKPQDEALKCVDGWSQWISSGILYNNTKGESVDNEPLPKINQFTQGQPMCEQTKMTKIECRTISTKVPSKETGLNVECSLERGLVCEERERECLDFEIRVLCSCDGHGHDDSPDFQCLNSIHPSFKHPDNCNQFYECTPDVVNPAAPHAVLKSCGDGLMYNPKAMVCDWPASVLAVRPECGSESTSTTSTTTYSTVTIPSTTEALCPPGQVYKPCAYACDKLCDHFKKTAIAKGKCRGGQKCIEGCVEESVALIQCDYGSLWRDERTCVPVKDCTCYSHDGDIVKPGGIKTDGCMKCQCVDNVFHCDSSECVAIVVPLSGTTHQSMIFGPTTPSFFTATEPVAQTTTPEPKTTTTEPKTTMTTVESTIAETETTVAIEETTPIIIVKSTMSPPPQCDERRYKNLLWGGDSLPDSAFTASSTINSFYKPQSAVLDAHLKDDSAGSWVPAIQNTEQYIQVELPTRQPIYAVLLQGSVLFDQYVTSYELLYGDDGVSFHKAFTAGDTTTFRGPIDHTKPMKQTITPPIEAKFLRIRPLTWHDAIAIRFELIGCGNEDSTTEFTTVTTVSPLPCTDILGIDSGLPIDNVEVSSNSQLRDQLTLTGDNGWKPLYSTPGEWVMFDFTSPRNVTGIKTKGGKSGWVTSYQIYYTSDLTNFNPIVDETKSILAFPANFDGNTAIFNEFRPPIHARYLKVIPLTWKDSIEMKIEPVGCFVSYPVTASVTHNPTAVTATTSASCAVCPGARPPAHRACECAPPNKYFDGENCLTRELCPCFVGFMAYAVGASFRNANCEECLCKLGGITDCKPVKQCKCDANLVPKLTKSCDCKCETCPKDTKICPTSKMCLALDKWCDGLQDCPDDEIGCATDGTTKGTVEPTVITTVAPTVGLSVTTPMPKKVECPKVECPPGYHVVRISPRPPTKQGSQKSRFSYQRYTKGYSKGGNYKGGYNKGYTVPQSPQGNHNQAFTLTKPSESATKSPMAEECVHFKCVPKPRTQGSKLTELCSAPTCPDKYTLKLETVDVNRCPQYTCEPPPERPSRCELTGRTVTTFDGSQYKVDVCFHILARDNAQDAWAVLVRKKCRIDSCTNELLIRQDDQLILIKPSLMIEYDNYEYTAEQTSLICFKKNSFDVDRLGNGLAVKSRRYNFTVFFSGDGDIQIGVYKSLLGKVDGLCGSYDSDAQNDRQLPDGNHVVGIEEFVQSWAKPGLAPDACQTKVISMERQKRAWAMCDAIVQEPLSHCNQVLNLDKWRSICLEKLCECQDLVVNGSRRSDEECRCVLLEQFVAECLTEREVPLGDWRIKYNCPADCPPPLVHYDCYRRSCEPTCDADRHRPCPPRAACAPGCYCPEGKLRYLDTCVTPDRCMDCVCNNLGAPSKFVTFEREELPFVGNCTYLASRDRNDTGHLYQVYVTNGECKDNPNGVCTKVIHLLTGNNIVRFEKDAISEKLQMTVNNEVIYTHPLDKDWIKTSLNNGDIAVILPEANLDLTIRRDKLEFTLKLPSYRYANSTEGLCGVCAGLLDQLVSSNGSVTDSIEEYGNSWKAKGSTLELLNINNQAHCGEITKQEECELPPPDKNPCYNLLNAEKFGACHALLDPAPYMVSCEADICSRTIDICGVLERYATDCRSRGICLQWRTELCPKLCESPFVYNHCAKCEMTCDDYSLYDRGVKKCNQIPVEGCFCPEGKVRINETCIEPSKCFPCDVDKQHFAGEEWQVDACTTCSCSRLPTGAVQTACTKQQCAPTVCADSEEMVAKPMVAGACCQEFLCSPKQEAQCLEAKVIKCGKDQVLKQRADVNGCKEYVCGLSMNLIRTMDGISYIIKVKQQKCRPQSECPALPDNGEVELVDPGMVIVVDNSSCCPTVLMVCKPETCPLPLECPKFHERIEQVAPGSCCKQYKCELPKDKCAVTLEWEALAEGGEKARTVTETLLKDLDTAWLDGPCRSCSCQLSPTGVASSTCAVTSCEPIAVNDQFVLEPRRVPFACCPIPEMVACRHYENIYKPGEEWINPSDVCETYKCLQIEDGKLEKVTRVQTCDTVCQPGFSYFPSDQSSVCCGACRPVACIVNGIEHTIGDNWLSDDHCTNYTCVENNGTLQVKSVKEECPQYSEEIRNDYVVNEVSVDGQCCNKSEIVACRYGNTTYEPNTTWQSKDPCKNVSCVRDVSGTLSMVPRELHCPECARATVAVPVTSQCCPRCQPIACIVGDVEKPIGSTWYSEDNCTTFSCDATDDGVMVTSATPACPDVAGCATEDLFNDTCCQICIQKPSALNGCGPVRIPLAGTVGAVRVRLHSHGLCTNRRPLTDFRECRGSCHSGTIYNNRTGVHDSECSCCQATRYSPLAVTLQCEDGAAHEHRVASPVACACLACGQLSPEKPGAASPTEEFEIPQIYQRFGP